MSLIHHSAILILNNDCSCFSYYEYIWQRNKGVNFGSLFQGMPISLQADISLSLYKKIIDQVGHPHSQYTYTHGILTTASSLQCMHTIISYSTLFRVHRCHCSRTQRLVSQNC